MAYVLCLQMEAWETTAEDALPGLAVYNVHDSPSPAVAPNRAQVSLPGNLALRYEDPCGAACTVVANDIIPRGTKFGPMAGDIFRYVEYRSIARRNSFCFATSNSKKNPAILDIRFEMGSVGL